MLQGFGNNESQQWTGCKSGRKTQDASCCKKREYLLAHMLKLNSTGVNRYDAEFVVCVYTYW